MGDWEREYATLAAQDSIGSPARVIVALSPYPSVRLECITCEEYLSGNPTTRRWECPECSVLEMDDRAVVDLLIASLDLVESKMMDMGLARPEGTERTAKTWLKALRK